MYEAIVEAIAHLSNAANREALLREVPDRTAGIQAQITRVQKRLAKFQEQRGRILCRGWRWRGRARQCGDGFFGLGAKPLRNQFILRP
jgi:hypothetical protein